MPFIETTWTVRHQRHLEHGEDPLSAGTVDIDHLLWAIDQGDVAISVALIERIEPA